MSDKPKLQIKFSDIFIKLVCDRTTELISEGKDEGVIKHEVFRNLSIFLNKEPKRILFVIPHDLLPVNLKGNKIFIGG